MEIKYAQKEIESGKSMPLMETSTIEYTRKPMGKAMMKKQENEKPKKKYTYDKYITCKVCGKDYTRPNRSAHVKTQHHKTYMKMDKVLRKLLLTKTPDDD